MKLFLVRHTEYYNPENIFAFHLPVYLSEIGREHARQIGDWFQKNGYTNIPIYTSSIVRAVQTAEIIAHFTNSSVAVDTNIDETNCKELEGTSKDIEREKGWQYEYDFPTREPIDVVLSRVLRTYEKCLGENKDAMLVSHGDPLTALAYHIQNKSKPKYLWDPKNSENVVHRGEVIEVVIENKKVVSYKRVIKGTETT